MSLLASSPAFSCGPHFLLGVSPECAPSKITYMRITISGSASQNTTRDIVDVKDLDCILVAIQRRSTSGVGSGEYWLAPLPTPLFQISGFFILCKDVNHTLYKTHSCPLSNLALKPTPDIGKRRCYPMLYGPEEEN